MESPINTYATTWCDVKEDWTIEVGRVPDRTLKAFPVSYSRVVIIVIIIFYGRLITEAVKFVWYSPRMSLGRHVCICWFSKNISNMMTFLRNANRKLKFSQRRHVVILHAIKYYLRKATCFELCSTTLTSVVVVSHLHQFAHSPGCFSWLWRWGCSDCILFVKVLQNHSAAYRNWSDTHTHTHTHTHTQDDYLQRRISFVF